MIISSELSHPISFVAKFQTAFICRLLCFFFFFFFFFFLIIIIIFKQTVDWKEVYI